MKKAIYIFLFLCLVCSLCYSSPYEVKKVQSGLDVELRVLEVDSLTSYDEDGNILFYYGDIYDRSTDSFNFKNDKYRGGEMYEYKDGRLDSITSYYENSEFIFEEQSFDYDEEGKLLEETCYKLYRSGSEWTTTINHEHENGNEIRVSSGRGDIEKKYNSEGVLISEEYYFWGKFLQWSKQYNDAGQIIRSYDKGDVIDKEILYEYSEVGGELIHRKEIETYHDYFGYSISNSWEINYWYENGLLKSVDYGYGSYITYEYNDEGQVIKSINQNGEEIIWEYDSQNRVTREEGIIDTYLFHEYLDGGITYSYELGWYEEITAYDDRGNETYYYILYSSDDLAEERWTEYQYYPDGSIKTKTVYTEYHDLESLDLDEIFNNHKASEIAMQKAIDKYFN